MDGRSAKQESPAGRRSGRGKKNNGQLQPAVVRAASALQPRHERKAPPDPACSPIPGGGTVGPAPSVPSDRERRANRSEAISREREIEAITRLQMASAGYRRGDAVKVWCTQIDMFNNERVEWCVVRTERDGRAATSSTLTPAFPFCSCATAQRSKMMDARLRQRGQAPRHGDWRPS